MKNQYDFTPVFRNNAYSAQTDTWKVELVDLGEGRHGDWDENDPNDEPLLRFDFYSRPHKRASWEVPNDSSYCTQLNADRVGDDKNLRKRILMYLLSQFCHEDWDTNIKKRCERLSWICDTDLEFQEEK